MLKITSKIIIPDNELEFQFIRAQGAGGQHVNKASTAVHLRFDFLSSPSLPEFHKQRLLAAQDRRISKDGVIVIKAQKHRSQEMNREDAVQRLGELIRSATRIAKKRRQTLPSKSSQLKRLETKTRLATTKKQRKTVHQNDY